MDSPQLICEQIVAKYKETNPAVAQIPPGVDYPPEPEMGDVAIAFPMRAAGPLERSPLSIAGELAEQIETKTAEIASVSVEEPGFVNCSFANDFLLEEMEESLRKGKLEFPNFGNNETVLLEFVSANPTGPLHVGHGRGAVYGDVLGRLFRRFGFQVQREYYVNDGGGQIEKLGESLRLRAREREGEEVNFSSEHYRGEYLKRIVANNQLDGDMEIEQLARTGTDKLLDRIFSTLQQARINFDNRVFESEVATGDAIEELMDRLRGRDVIYEKDEAQFLETTAGGDDKDRVLVRSNGEPTYFANDLLYHLNKYEREFDNYLNIWGHDHHGYQQRLQTGLDFLGCDLDDLEIELYQLVNLYRDGEPLAMSTREGEFVSLQELLEEVGTDAVRFNFLTQNHNSPLDFDIEVATSETEENSVYYVQYAHTRLAGILRKGGEKFSGVEPADELSADGHRLLLRGLDFPTLVGRFLEGRQPHRLTFWLQDLARRFHTYYTHHQVIDPEKPAVSARRISLVRFLKLVFQTGLELLKVNAPEKM